MLTHLLPHLPHLHDTAFCEACTELRPAAPRVTVVIPALNEALNLGWVLDRIPRDTYEVILVDGNSVDATIEVARSARPDIRVLTQEACGKGAALATGLAAATGDIAVIIDADGSMDPAEIPAFVGALLAGADVVKGCRSAPAGGSSDLTVLRTAGNWGLTFLTNRLYHSTWRELCYGFAAFWTDVLPMLGVHDLAAPDGPGRPRIPWSKSQMTYGHGFEIEALLFCRSKRAGLRVAEVFSFEHERRNGKTHLCTWRDGWRVLTAVRREFSYSFVGEIHRHLRSYPILPYLHAGNGHLQSQREVALVGNRL